MLEFIYKGGPFMWPLIAASVTSLAFMIERALALRWRQVIPAVVENSAKACQTPEDATMLRRLCQQNDSPAARLLILTIDRLHWPKAENVEALQTRARKEVAGLERGLVMIEAIVGSAPLLGLVGTLDGLIRSFGRFNEASLENSDVLAEGISIALHTTLTGLLIAIPSLIAWSYFTRKVETLTIELETLCDLLLQRFYTPPPPKGKTEGRSIGHCR